MEAKQYLRQAHRLNELIASEQEELNELRRLAETVSSPVISDMPKNPSSSLEAPYVKYVLKMAELEKKIEQEMEHYLSIKDEIRDVINEVTNNEERLLLRYRYINFLEWEEICDRMNVSERTVHRIHSSALQKVIVPSHI